MRCQTFFVSFLSAETLNSSKQIQSVEISKNKKPEIIHSLDGIRSELAAINKQIFVTLSQRQTLDKKSQTNTIKQKIIALGVNQMQFYRLMSALNSLRKE